jgi:hypothetical protein
MACHCRTHARLRLEYDQQNRGLLAACGCDVSASGIFVLPKKTGTHNVIEARPNAPEAKCLRA